MNSVLRADVFFFFFFNLEREINERNRIVTESVSFSSTLSSF